DGDGGSIQLSPVRTGRSVNLCSLREPFSCSIALYKLKASLSQVMKEPNCEETIFAAALALPPGERAAYLDRACDGDAALRRHVEVLLNGHAAGAFLEEPAAAVTAHTLQISPPISDRPGDKIGRYKLLQQIGEGGCGVVYMAEQTEPVHRRVALKIIKLGMDTKQVIARFESERQALALMDH